MDIADIAKALGDQSRQRIVELLKDGELPATDIFKQFTYAAPTISRHLSVLKDAGLVTTRRNGVFIYYRLENETFTKLDDWLSPFLPKKPKVPLKDKIISTPNPPIENPFDKFQSDF